MSETTSTPLLSRKQSILEKNVSDKSCEVLNDPFSDLISLTFDSVTKVRAMSLYIFKWNSVFFITYSYSTPRELSKTLIKCFSIKYFSNYKA